MVLVYCAFLSLDLALTHAQYTYHCRTAHSKQVEGLCKSQGRFAVVDSGQRSRREALTVDTLFVAHERGAGD